MARERVVAGALDLERRALVRAVMAGVLVAGASVGLAGTSAWLIVRAAERPAILSLTFPMGLVQVFALAKAAGRYLERTQTHDAALSVMGHVRARVARTLEPLLPAGLGPRSADVVDTVLRDVDRVQDLLTTVIGPLLASTVAGLGTVVLCGVLVPWAGGAVALGLLASGVALPGLAARLGAGPERELDDVRRSMVDLFARAAHSGDEYVMAGASGALVGEWTALEARFDRAETRRTLARGLIVALHTLVAGTTALVVAVLSASAFEHGRLGTSLLAVPALLSIAALELISGVSPSLVGLPGDRRALERVEALGGRPAPVAEPLVEGPGVRRASSVVARSLTQRYGGESVLEGVDLDLVAGDCVVIHGSSGSGKTTLARLVAKFLDPSEGTLSLGGIDYAALSSRQVRERVGFVDDAPYLFSTTLAGNLRVVVPGASDDELRDALVRAGLATLLESAPEGLATPIDGVRGGVSGGERRRLGLARELLVTRDVVVLDEPTEGLDEASAEGVRAQLASTYRDGIVLVVSHFARDDRFATRSLELVRGTLRERAPSA